MARQREGDVSTFNFIDNLSRGIEHLGRVVVDLIPKVYTAPRIVRCVKEDGSTYSVPVNQPVVPAQPEQGQQPAPGMPQEQFEPAPEHVDGITKIFDLTTGKYDVTVAAGPSFTSKREESAEQMMEFIRVFPQSAPLIGDLLAKNLDWPGSDEVAARLKAMLPPQAAGQGNQELQQMQQQMQQLDQHAREAVGQLQQENQQLKQQVQDKTQDAAINAKKLELDAFKAETDRIKALADIQNAEKDRQARVIESANQVNAAQAAANQKQLTGE
jgi:flagellar motility protein MotE (MotC chaperone)